MMVSAVAEPTALVFSTGRRFAGMKQTAAAIANAQVRWME
jgi:hypothetical protein